VKGFTFYSVLLTFFFSIYNIFSIRNISNYKRIYVSSHIIAGFLKTKHHNDPTGHFYFYFTGEEIKVCHTLFKKKKIGQNL
jgi:hypothetical protein